MSKKNKVIYSNIQPNTKEAGIWVNTDDGNIKIEKDGKWVDDGGNGGSAEASTVEYLDVSGVNQELYFTSLFLMSFVSKMKENGVVAILPSAAMVGYDNSLIISLVIDFSFKTSNGTLLELVLNMGITKEQLDAIPRITKEQFYSLES